MTANTALALRRAVKTVQYSASCPPRYAKGRGQKNFFTHSAHKIDPHLQNRGAAPAIT